MFLFQLTDKVSNISDCEFSVEATFLDDSPFQSKEKLTRFSGYSTLPNWTGRCFLGYVLKSFAMNVIGGLTLGGKIDLIPILKKDLTLPSGLKPPEEQTPEAKR